MLKICVCSHLGTIRTIYHNKINIFFLFKQIFAVDIEIKLYTFYQQSY